MRQFQFEYSDKTSFKKELVKIRQWCKTHMVSDLFFTVFSETVEKERIQTVLDLIEKEMPNARRVFSLRFSSIPLAQAPRSAATLSSASQRGSALAPSSTAPSEQTLSASWLPRKASVSVTV